MNNTIHTRPTFSVVNWLRDLIHDPNLYCVALAVGSLILIETTLFA